MTEKKKLKDYNSEIKELSTLEDKKIKITLETMTGFQNVIKINIDKSLINSNLVDKDEEIIFLLLIKYNHPFSSPYLFCLTKFSVPELSDGRDFLEEVLSKPWIPKKKNTLKKIISLIPNFINNYLQNFSFQKDLKIIGKYYLDNIYELNVLKLFPHLFFGDVIEIVAFGNDKRVYDEKRIIMITEGFLLLFVEKSVFEVQKLKLIFWGPINSLSLIKQIDNRNVIELKWKAKKDKTSLMRLKTEKSEEIFEILMDCLTKKKIEFKLANESSGVKKGELPQIDIVSVEQEISKLEIKIKIKGKDNSNAENTKQLMNLYEKAVQYYSAVNDYRYQIYMRKTKKLFSQMSDKDLGIKKSGDKKKKGKKGKIKKEKSKIKEKDDETKMENNNEEKKEINNKNEKEKEEKNEDKIGENTKDNKNNDKNEIKQDKKEDKNEEKHNNKKEEIKEEIKEDKKDDKKNDKKNEEKQDNKNNEKKIEKEEKQNIKKSDKNEDNNKIQKVDDKEKKSETRQKFEKFGFDLDLDDED